MPSVRQRALVISADFAVLPNSSRNALRLPAVILLDTWNVVSDGRRQLSASCSLQKFSAPLMLEWNESAFLIPNLRAASLSATLIATCRASASVRPRRRFTSLFDAIRRAMRALAHGHRQDLIINDRVKLDRSLVGHREERLP